MPRQNDLEIQGGDRVSQKVVQLSDYWTTERKEKTVRELIDKNSLFVGRSIGKLSLCVKHKMPA